MSSVIVILGVVEKLEGDETAMARPDLITQGGTLEKTSHLRYDFIQKRKYNYAINPK